MYGAELAEVYELIYRSRGKDWAQEARFVTDLIRSRCPDADSLLDVACGTGAHLSALAGMFKVAEGLEPAPAMRKLAAERLPAAALHDGDMRRFRLGTRYSAVTCMFCAIAYLGTVEDLRDAVRSMAGHLLPGGVLVIEPWWFPEDFIDGYVAGDLATEDGRTVTRISHSTLRGRATHMEVRYMVGDAMGIREFTEHDVLTLFTKEEYLSAFEDAGCPAEFLPGPPTGRGIFVGVMS
ncbi:trans-aconitate 2-methyltransferase [Streptomyces griseus]|uniref:class I SAM-dependent methyltransferase n=1 Tax=Streptomyces griseus TaxID=1911 RepID=UPI00056A9A57|nr:class I SAM-dependent methyltransferase [Streptomyces griseus]